MIADIRAILGLNVCDQGSKEQCWKSYKGKLSEFKNLCARCEKKKGRKISDWTLHLLDLRRLTLAGYPFGKDDLSYEEWVDLGLINEMLKSSGSR